MIETRITKHRTRIKIKIGEEFERWTVLEFAEVRKGRAYYKCTCKCGNIKTVSGSDLRSGHTKSCGCLHMEQCTKHNMCGTFTYSTWKSMIQRCTNPNYPAYIYYGGRGITICKEWKDSFEAFFRDMGERPLELTLDRKNSNLGYFKENCRWATKAEQARNCRICKNNKTGMTGVYWYEKCRKYIVRITVDYRNRYIGRFKNLEDAKAARLAAERKYWR